MLEKNAAILGWEGACFVPSCAEGYYRDDPALYHDLLVIGNFNTALIGYTKKRYSNVAIVGSGNTLKTIFPKIKEMAVLEHRAFKSHILELVIRKIKHDYAQAYSPRWVLKTHPTPTSDIGYQLYVAKSLFMTVGGLGLLPQNYNDKYRLAIRIEELEKKVEAGGGEGARAYMELKSISETDECKNLKKFYTETLVQWRTSLFPFINGTPFMWGMKREPFLEIISDDGVAEFQKKIKAVNEFLQGSFHFCDVKKSSKAGTRDVSTVISSHQPQGNGPISLFKFIKTYRGETPMPVFAGTPDDQFMMKQLIDKKPSELSGSSFELIDASIPLVAGKSQLMKAQDIFKALKAPCPPDLIPTKKLLNMLKEAKDRFQVRVHSLEDNLLELPDWQKHVTISPRSSVDISPRSFGDGAGTSYLKPPRDLNLNYERPPVF